ncbi:MAG TPA: energy transducer TonB [Opitutus sp.]|nr:energy transducer TonB [Opitutus sp.]
MPSATTRPMPGSVLPEFSRQLLSLGIGLAVSWLIFFGLSRVQYREAAAPPPPVEDLRAVELPFEPPPPPVRPKEAPPIAMSNLIVLAPQRSDSPVKLPSVPILPETVPPVMGVPKIDFKLKDFKPAEINSEFETRHVFEAREVDQICVALVKVRPEITRLMLHAAKHQRVIFICVVNRDGSVEGIRVVESSGSRDLDDASSEALRNWKFSPALRHGHAVRQWVQQSFLYKLDEGSPLEVH